MKKRGITLLLTVLILAAAISIALGIFYIIFVQLQITRGIKESYKAFYSAETGQECALYYLQRYGSAADGGYWSPFNPCLGDCSALIRCAGSNVPVTHTVSGVIHTYTFSVNTADACTDVVVQSKDLGSDLFEAVLTSKGKNSCSPSSFNVNRTLVYCSNATQPCSI